MSTISFKNHQLDNWSDFFLKRLSVDNEFVREENGRSGDTTFETFRPIDTSNLLKIEVAYLDNYKKLLFYRIRHPLTKGFTEYEDKFVQYFEEGMYESPPRYGGPGLDFHELNINEINKELIKGLDGQEHQYFNGSELIKSKVLLPPDNFPIVYRFDDKSFLSKLTDWITSVDEEKSMNIKEIQLAEIFGGIK